MRIANTENWLGTTEQWLANTDGWAHLIDTQNANNKLWANFALANAYTADGNALNANAAAYLAFNQSPGIRRRCFS